MWVPAFPAGWGPVKVSLMTFGLRDSGMVSSSFEQTNTCPSVSTETTSMPARYSSDRSLITTGGLGRVRLVSAEVMKMASAAFPLGGTLRP